MKKNIIILGSALLAFSSLVAADWGMMKSSGGYCPYSGMMGGYGMFKMIAFAFGVFIFSLIFWGTYLWIAKDKKK